MFIKIGDLVWTWKSVRCETLNKKIIIRVLCVVALALSSADLVLMKTVDRETVKAHSFQIKAHNNDNGFSISRFAATPYWQELSVSAHHEEVRQ
jgi:hypothetical protein